MNRLAIKSLALAMAWAMPGLAMAQSTPIDVLNRFTDSGSQREVARAIGTLCPAGNRLSARLQQDCNSLVGAAFGNDASVRSAISRITPDNVRVAVDRGQLLRRSQNRAARGAAIGAGKFPGGGMALGENWISSDGYSYASAGESFGDWGFYATLEFNRSERDASLNQDGFDGDGQSLTLGLDHRFDGGWVFGGSVLFGSSDVDFTAGSGDQEIDERGFNLHASWAGATGWYADSLLSFGQRETDQTRLIGYTLGSGNSSVGVNQSYSADYDSDTRLIAVTLGRRFDQGSWSFDPYAMLESLQADVDAYDEIASSPDAAGAGWAVRVAEQEESFTRGTLGVRASWVLSGDNGVFLPFIDLGFVNVLNSDEADAFVRYTGDRSDAVGQQRLNFAMRADGEDDSYGRVAIGISAQFAEGRSGFVRYAQHFGEARYSVREFQLGGRFEF